MSRVGVVIAAGGQGKRLGGRIPKQFLKFGRTSVIQTTLEVFQRSGTVQEIVVAAPGKYIKRLRNIVRRAGFSKVMNIVPAGSERQHSVWNGLQGFSVEPDIVLVHDAARPLVTRKIIGDVVRAAERHGGAIAAVRMKDTVKVEGRKGWFDRTLDRKDLWAVQTPQGFAFETLIKAHRHAQRTGFLGTDESSLVERLRIPVRIVEGSPDNIKITTREDLNLAGYLIKRRAGTRAGLPGP